MIATEAAYPPFNDTDASGQIIGFDVDVMNALCAEMHAHCQIIAQDWDGLIPSLLAGKYDAIIAGMSITPERQAQVDFRTLIFQIRSFGFCQKVMAALIPIISPIKPLPVSVVLLVLPISPKNMMVKMAIVFSCMTPTPMLIWTQKQDAIMQSWLKSIGY